MTEEIWRTSKTISSKTLSISRSNNQLLKMEKVTSTLQRVALIQTSNKTPMISWLNTTFSTSKTPVKLGLLVQVLALLVEICFRVQIHLTRITQPCKCSCQITKQIFQSFWASDLKELITKCWISQNTFTSFRCKLIKDWVTWLKTWHCFTRTWTK